MIKSSLGGVCRLRSYIPLNGKGLKKAKGQNPNPSFAIPDVKEPLISSEIPGLNLREVYEYDIKTRKGGVIQVTRY